MIRIRAVGVTLSAFDPVQGAFLAYDQTTGRVVVAWGAFVEPGAGFLYGAEVYRARAYTPAGAAEETGTGRAKGTKLGR